MKKRLIYLFILTLSLSLFMLGCLKSKIKNQINHDGVFKITKIIFSADNTNLKKGDIFGNTRNISIFFEPKAEFGSAQAAITFDSAISKDDLSKIFCNYDSKHGTVPVKFLNVAVMETMEVKEDHEEFFLKSEYLTSPKSDLKAKVSIDENNNSILNIQFPDSSKEHPNYYNTPDPYRGSYASLMIEFNHDKNSKIQTSTTDSVMMSNIGYTGVLYTDLNSLPVFGVGLHWTCGLY